MGTTNKIILGVLVAAIMIIGVGYATLSDRELNITGTVEAQATQTDFRVEFPSPGTAVEIWDSNNANGEGENGQGTVTASYTDATTAKFNASNLKVLGDTCSATYTIQNLSKGIYANNVRATVTSGTNDYIEVTVSEPTQTSLAPNESCTVTVTATVIKTPLTEQSTTVGVQLLATPGEEGEGVSTITFSLANHQFTAEEGMTWGEFVTRTDLHNVDGISINFVSVSNQIIFYYTDDVTEYALLNSSYNSVYADDVIINGETYNSELYS